ncbi:MAG: hypothetical protein KF760_21310 [Candidatus Eremiobacteraeota bacterium]|nr:hypothetical protein [Candidatus Eremiobacteraeota bacterium]
MASEASAGAARRGVDFSLEKVPDLTSEDVRPYFLWSEELAPHLGPPQAG